MKWLKEQSIEFYEAGIQALIWMWNMLMKDFVTMLRSRDVIYKGPASFWCMIHVPVLVIIPVLRKKALLFDSPSYYKNFSKFPFTLKCFSHGVSCRKLAILYTGFNLRSLNCLCYNSVIQISSIFCLLLK